jgi:signal transduction histidine kinase
MAGQLRESYENLEVRVDQRTQELTALNSIASVVSQSLDLDQILPDALTKTIEVMGMEAGGVFRLEESGNYLVLVAHQNLCQQLIDLSQKMPLHTSIISEVALQKHPVSRLTEDYAPGPVKTTLQANGWQTVVSIPLLAQEKVLGAINVLSSKPVQLSDEELAVPAAIGQQIGVAMDNARLYNQTLEYANQMEVAKQAEESARIAAEAANAAKSDFLANVSHELRTPLVSIYGFARLVRKRLNERVLPALEASDPKARRVVDQIDENLAIIISEGRRLTALINSLLDIEKIESGRMEFDMQLLDIRTVIEKGASATASFFENPRLELVVHTPPQPILVSGDRDRLIQVFINLLSNAVKFTPQGQIVITAQALDQEVIIHVADQGAGIDPIDFERVFEKFTQVGDTMTNKPKGTGLGLAISREIIEKHGGRIWVSSEPGKGSTFSFTLPLVLAVDQVVDD